MDSEDKENIIKVVDDLMNFSMDSLALGRGDSADSVGSSEKEQATPEKKPAGESVDDHVAQPEVTEQDKKIPTDCGGEQVNKGEEEEVRHHPQDETQQSEMEMTLDESVRESIGPALVFDATSTREQWEFEESNKPKETVHMSFQTAIANDSRSSSVNEDEIGEGGSIETNTENKNTSTSLQQTEEVEVQKSEPQTETEKMEFTKNYSDDLLMGQNDGSQGVGGVNLADFELPPYSVGEPKQESPVKRKSSSSSSTAQPSSSQQQSSVGLKGIIDLLKTSYSMTSHILLWKRPIETGIYFGIGVTLITAFTFFSIISVIAYSALGIMLTSGLIRAYKSVMQTLDRSPETPFDHVWDKVLAMNLSISQASVHEFIDVSLDNINSSLTYFKQVLLFEDKIATLKFGFYFYLLTYIGSWFNGMTLITLCYLCLFSLPIAYEKNKLQFDQCFNMIQGHVCSTTNKFSSIVFGGSKNNPGSKKQD